MNWKERYEDWSKQPLGYSFNRSFFLVSIIYCICTFYDFSLTYITYRLDSNNFFMHEISFIIKKAYGGDPFFCMLMIVFFMLPLIVVYGLNVYMMKQYGMEVNGIRICLYAIYSISLLHIIGGLTNFFYLINME